MTSSLFPFNMILIRFIAFFMCCIPVQLLLFNSCPALSEFFKFRATENVEVSQRATVRVLASSLAPIITINWNLTGHVESASGFAPYILDLVTQQLGLTYCWVPIGGELPFDDTTANNKGLISYMLEGTGDLIVGTVIRTLARSRLIDFTMPTAGGGYSIMLPFPEKRVNKSALFHPFQKLVWISLLITVITVCLSLYLFKRNINGINLNKTKENTYEYELFDQISYVLTVLFGQGDYCPSKLTTVRFIAGSWCLAACVLVPAYSGTLLSFIMSPTSKPLVESIYDIDRVPGLKVALDRSRAADQRLLAAAGDNNSAFGKVAANIQKTIFRCNVSSECINRVLTGNYVYIHGELTIDAMIFDDLQKIGYCRFTKSKEAFFRGFLHWAMPKNSRLQNDFDMALLQLDASGLSEFWKRQFIKTASKCLQPDGVKPEKSSRLSLAQLSSSFMVLGAGYLLGFSAFLVEELSLISSFASSH